MTFQLPSANDKAEYVLRQFDRIAANYDLTNDLISLCLHRLWKRRAIEALALKPGGIYLDVCCGTGDLALAIALRLSNSGRVVGIDFSQNMLDLAKRRSEAIAASRADLAKIDWLKGDAEHLPFADRSFDGAIISFGLRNLTSLKQGLSEMARVVKSNGTVVNLDLGHPKAPIFTPIYHLYFEKFVPLIGDLVAGDRSAYTYLPSSLKAYPKPEGITELFADAGLTDITHQPLALGSVALHKGTVP
jgi:demethylmenaquinone methyltransferase/2-methoxy-6-polyprenyl-1,4-benzoquinol methylase